MTLGSPLATWGLTLTPALVNDPGFGIVSELTTIKAGTESVDLTQIEIFYTPAGAPPDYIDGGRGPVAVHTPPSYDPETPMPLVFLLHGYTASGAIQESYMQFTPLADEFGFLYLHPDGRTETEGDFEQFWSGTDACCNFYGASDDDDDYLLALIDEMKSLFNVDDQRVYLIGYSNGGFMSYRMACENSDTIAAIASLAGATFFDPLDCQPPDPVHVLQIHGTSDGTILYAGGDIFGTNYPGAVATVEQWAAKNGCDIVADTSAPNIDLDGGISGTESTVTRYISNCNPRGVTELWSIIGGGHIPTLSATFSRQIVEWLYAHPKSIDESWVDFEWSGAKYGTEDKPFDTLTEAANATAPAGHVKIKGDTGVNSSSETLTIERAMTIEAVEGSVFIGSPEARIFEDNNRSGFIARR